MNKFRIAAATFATLVMVAGCSKKAPDELPPPPATGPETGGGTGTETGGIGETAVPGSRAHFVENVIADRVYFDTDMHTLDDRARATLDSQAQWMLAYPNVTVTIEGHADERGTREYNLALGERRANAAKNYLAARGVPASRMTTISWGKERPEALGSDETAWAQNRRAVTIVPQ